MRRIEKRALFVTKFGAVPLQTPLPNEDYLQIKPIK
jgi:hypothetical protein